MKKIIILLLLLPISSMSQIIKFRISESDTILPTLQSLQGGTLLRYRWERIKKDSVAFWRCKEMWVPRWISDKQLNAILSDKIKDKVLIDGLTNLYQSKVKIDSTKYIIDQIVQEYKKLISNCALYDQRRIAKILALYFRSQTKIKVYINGEASDKPIAF